MSEIHHRSNTLSVFSHALILLLLTSALGLAGTSMAIGGVPDSSASLSAGSGSGLPGSSVDLTISLAPGSANVCTLQFDLGLPSSLTYVSTSTGSAAAAASKSASANPVSGGIRVLVFGLNVNTIGTGPVAVVRVAIASGTPAGPLTVGLSNLAASDPSGNSISITETDGTVTVLTSSDTTPPTISAVASSGITSSGATITWTTNEASDSQIDYGTTSSYGSSTTLNTSLVTAHSQTLSGLTAGALYHYRVKSKDAAGNLASSGDYTFTTSSDTTPPTISAVASSGITASGATITWTTNEVSDSQVDYGTTVSYGSSTTLNTTLVTSHSQTLSGLTVGTLYHYRVKSKDAAGNAAASGDYTFTTSSDITPPTISAVASSGMTTSGATITWTTSEASTSQVDYGTTASYGSSTTLNTSLVNSHSQSLTGLAGGTTYHYHVKSKDAAGNLATSGDYNFRTVSDTTPPTISAVASSGITTSGATITWTTSEASDSQIDYGTTSSYGASTTLNSSLVTSHSQSLTGLAAGTTYHYHVKSKDSAGNLATSGDYSFRTVSDTTPPTISAVASSGVTSSGTAITWTTNEASTSQLDYGTATSYGSSTVLDSGLVTAHTQLLSGLSASTTYHYHVKSKDAAGNLATSGDYTFKTLAQSAGPIISSIMVSGITSTAATISWLTDVAADTQLSYGTTSDCALSTGLDTSLTTSHSQNLKGLQEGTTYYFKVESNNAAGKLSVSNVQSFQTLPSKTVKLVYPRLAAKNPSAAAPAADDSEYTGIAIVNLGSTSSVITFTAYDESGAQMTGPSINNPVQRTLAPGSQLVTIDTELFGSGLADQDSLGWINIDSSTNIVTGFTVTFNGSLSMMDGAPVTAAPMTQFDFTEIEDQGFTILHVANPNDSPANVTFQLVGSDGTIRTATLQSINPMGGMALTVMDLFPGVVAQASDYVRVVSDVGVVPFELTGQPSQDVAGLNGLGLDAAATTLFCPQYAVGGGYRSTLSITNLDDMGGNLVLRLFGNNGVQIGDTRSMSIAPNGKVYISDQTFFADPGSGSIQGYVVITSNGLTIRGDVTFGDPARKTFVTSLPLVSSLDDTLVFSQVASDATYFMGLALLNPNATDAAATIELRNQDGTVNHSVTLKIPSHQRICELLEEIFPDLGNQQASGYILVSVDQGIAGFSVFATRDLRIMTAVPAQVIK